MILKTDFDVFLKEIRPTQAMRDDLKMGHQTLRERLRNFDSIKNLLVSDFLQGSYRRYTAVRPKNEKRSDVDIIVVTKLSEDEYSPSEAMELFVPFLEKYYKGKWRRQGRSFGIEMSYVELDLVVTSAPSEQEYGILQSDAVTTDENLVDARDWRLHKAWLAVEHRQANVAEFLFKAANEAEWKAQPLRIPDRVAEKWDDTHPLEQLIWTRDKNDCCGGHFVNVVKALKWWRLEHFEIPKHPKGFPLERLIGEHCPDEINSVAEGIVNTLENIVKAYASFDRKPQLPDYGVPSHDVFQRISLEDFRLFYNQVRKAAELARCAYDEEDRKQSGEFWRELLGSKFPKPPDSVPNKKVGFSVPTAPAIPGSGRFA